MKPRKFTVSPKVVTASQGSEYASEMANILRGMIETPFQTKIYAKFMNIDNEYKEAWLAGVMDMYSLSGCTEDISATNDLYNFVSQFGIERTMSAINEYKSSQLPDKHIMSFMCPICHNKTVYDIDRDVHSPLEAHYGDRFICDECGSEFEGSLGFDNRIHLDLIKEDDE